MRRPELRLPAALAFAALSTQAAAAQSGKQPGLIDRHALVTRHNVVLTRYNGERPLQVGNGEFAFGMDITGLQTFAPFNPMSHWGWHSSPMPAGQRVEEFQGQVVDTHGRPVRYPLPDPNRPELSAWMASNPHRINLGGIGLMLTRKDGTPATPGDLRNARQTLDLWNGVVTSRFEIDGDPVVVTTACHPAQDIVAARVVSPLVRAGRLAVFAECPGDSSAQFENFVGDRLHPVRLERAGPVRGSRADFVRRMDDLSYHITLAWDCPATLQAPGASAEAGPLKIVKAEYGAGDRWLDVTAAAAQAVREGRLSLQAGNALGEDPAPHVVKRLRVTYALGPRVETAEVGENEELTLDPAYLRNRITLQPAGTTDTISFTCAFTRRAAPASQCDCASIFAGCRRKWPAFWRSGGAIDLSESLDPRWRELERRIVLSQYLMRINEAGSQPPQESGLANNGWYGRFHMEMLWWHAAHWALWNRLGEAERSLAIYQRLLPQAEQLAKSEGYAGARWPKCIGPDGREWPYVIHAFLVWQQPHPIFFAELEYRAHPNLATLRKWLPVVEATADFLA